ncbi:hypothetical protein PMIN01_10615 [Paraphaeosphaeria minitans]|uniref:Uncharacterized protein n=1 Tax=Paraphaeosphaeria minitans TaxID=565426 RepID=A0A9P6GA97_9PLEO|nr:hypothetical protein PMIN01_10615 [Paraphaeosphaeria minitans]
MMAAGGQDTTPRLARVSTVSKCLGQAVSSNVEPGGVGTQKPQSLSSCRKGRAVEKAKQEATLKAFEGKRHVARLVCDDPCTRPTQVVPCAHPYHNLRLACPMPAFIRTHVRMLACASWVTPALDLQYDSASFHRHSTR